MYTKDFANQQAFIASAIAAALAPTNAILATIRNDLTTVQTDLRTVQTDLRTVQTDLRTVQTDLKTHIINVQWSEARLFNRTTAITLASPLRELVNNQNVLPSQAQPPIAFPATLGDLREMDGQALTDLLNFYQLPVSHRINDRRRSLCAFLGLVNL
eukprot:TRINITY_DN2233_c0_g1_i1.p1 TRINITY_DN2233_c0_g1~~TRINITY_DN2233_c0_g1_i1.p1  ORF type:complete len:157 (+),score=4.59 TRINITY_DN2233_c0_g1_i1:78-548(+)